MYSWSGMPLEPGDPFGLPAAGPLKLLPKFFDPPTDRFHFGLLWIELPDGDWVILESVNSTHWVGPIPLLKQGLTVNRLSRYSGVNIKFYRVNCPLDLRHQVPIELTKLGMSNYDFAFPFKVMVGAGSAWAYMLAKDHDLRKLTADDLKLSWADSSPQCIELFLVGYDLVGVNIVPLGRAPLPCAIPMAIREGKMWEIVKL